MSDPPTVQPRAVPRISVEQAEALTAAVRQAGAALAGMRACLEAAAPRTVAAMAASRQAWRAEMEQHPLIRAVRPPGQR